MERILRAFVRIVVTIVAIFLLALLLRFGWGLISSLWGSVASAGSTAAAAIQNNPTPAPIAEGSLTSAPAVADSTVAQTAAEPRLIAEISIEGQNPTKVYSPQVDDGGPCWFYAGPGLNRTVGVSVKLLEGAAFAADADAIKVGDKMLGKQNDADDVIVFADTPGTYTFTAYSVGLCVANASPAPGKADKVFANRDYNGDNRPAYWLGPAGEVTKTR